MPTCPVRAAAAASTACAALQGPPLPASRQPSYFAGRGASALDKAARDADAVIGLRSLWPDDPLYPLARRSNIRIVEVDAARPVDGSLPGIAVQPGSLKDGLNSQPWLSSNNLGRMADVLAAVAAAEARLTEAETRAAALAEQSTASAAAITRAAAIGRIAAALDSGAPYSSALPDLGDLPPVLADNAAAGLPTIADLQDSFAPAARASLEAALRANMGESWTERVSSFLRSQTGLRSLTPREGDDPDAVLSRAEAALSAGRVAEAIAELQAMPEAGKPALQDWLTLAQTRVDAEAAVAALAVN